MEHEHEHEFVLEIPEFEHLSYEVEEGIALVTLKRPEALNALSQSLLEELRTPRSGRSSSPGKGRPSPRGPT